MSNSSSKGTALITGASRGIGASGWRAGMVYIGAAIIRC